MSQITSISLRDRLQAMPSLSDASRLNGQRSFEKAMGRATTSANATTSAGATPNRQDEARAAAEELVSRALVQPILAKWREARDAAPPFGPSETERAFGSIMDAQFADRLTKGGNWGLVDAVARRIANAGGSSAASAANAAEAGAPGIAAIGSAPLSVAAWAGVRRPSK